MTEKQIACPDQTALQVKITAKEVERQGDIKVKEIIEKGGKK